MSESYSQSVEELTLSCDTKSDGGSSDTTLCSSLWDQATQRLDTKMQAAIKELRNRSCKPDELLGAVHEEVEKCKAKQWRFYTTRSGRRIFVRDIFSRVVEVLEKITSVGDTLAQYDPGHLAIPWAFARFLLIATTSDINTYGAMLESMQMVTDIISRYLIIESIYLQPGLECSSKLESAIVSLYTAILLYLCKAKLYFGHNTLVRIGTSILKVEQDTTKLMEDISKEEEKVEKWVAVCSAKQALDTYSRVGTLDGHLEELHRASHERTLKLQDSLTQMQKPVCRMADQMDFIQLSIEASEKTRIIKWISSLGKEYEKNHSTKARNRLKDSGQWLLRTHKYRQWLNCSSCSVLWLYGSAGYGKSFLVSLVVDLLIQERQQNPKAAYLAYFYCTRDPAEPKRAQPVEILRSIVRQLSCSNSHTPIRSPVLQKWHERIEEESDHRLDTEECISVLLDLTRENPAVICIDALDECDPSTRRDLLDAIGTIIKYSQQIVKVFVSSRREDDFLHYFEKWESLQISARENREDIINFVDEELKRSTENRTLLHGNASEDLTNDIKQVLLDRADGMFRWVSASLQTLCDPQMVLEQEVREALGKLPDELNDVYDVICSQIERRPNLGKKMAENALTWLLYANKPLSCNEMIKAITADSKSASGSITKDQVLSICCNFVKLDDEIGVFQFVHLSVREYLEKRPEYEASLSHATIAQSCLQACLTNMKPKRRANLQNFQSKTFYDYAQVYWPLHCQMAKRYRRTAPLEASFRALLCNGRFPTRQFSDWINRWSDSWSQMELEQRRGAEMNMYEKLNECMEVYRSGNPVFAACVFGFVEVVEDRRQAGMGSKDATWRNSYGRDPYEVAIRYGQEDVINLLRSTTSLDSVAARESALLSAISLGEMSMVTMLLNDHADLTITDEIIAAAASNCDVTMMKFLVNRYLDFTSTEPLLLVAASNELHGQDMIQYLIEEGDGIEDIDHTALLEAACKNARCGLDIVQFVIGQLDDMSVTEEVLEAAAVHPFDAYQMMRALLKIDKDITITENIVKAASQNPNAETLRLLFSHFPALPVTWDILNTAASNVECGHKILLLLLENCKEAEIDEDLMLAAVANEKLAQELLDVLLPRVEADSITVDVLKAAAQNRFSGHLSIHRLLRHSPGIQLDPTVIEAGSRNPYFAPEVVHILLKHDSSILFTTATFEAAAANFECSVELLDILLAREEEKNNHKDVTHPQSSLHPPFVIIPEVLEVAASNAESGSDIIRFLLKRIPNFSITPEAVENAAGNPEFGEEIINLWIAHKKVFKITTEAIKRAAGNQNTGFQVLTLLLRCDRRVTVTNEALEVAAANPYHGFQMVKALIPRWKSPDGFEQIISRAARNAQCGLQIIAYLLKQQKGFISSDVIESCASSPFADKEMMTALLNASPGIPLGLETVEAASAHPHHFFDILAALRVHDPNVPITNAAMYAIAGGSYNIIEAMQLLRKYHKGLIVTEGLLKKVVQNINANEATIVFLCEFQKEQGSGSGILPVTEEVLTAAISNSGNGAVSMAKMLLRYQPPGDWDPSFSGKMVEAATLSYRGEAMISVLVKYAQENGQVLRITSKALRHAARQFAPKTLKALLKILPQGSEDLIATPDVLQEAARSVNRSKLKLLIAYAAERNIGLDINETVLEAAMQASPETSKMIFKFWASNDQVDLMQKCITEKVLEAAAWRLRVLWRFEAGSEKSTFHFICRTLQGQGRRIPLTAKIFENALYRSIASRSSRRCSAMIEYFQRLAHRQGQQLDLENIITTEALKTVTGSGDEHDIAHLLSFLSEQKKDQVLTRDVLLAAAGTGSDHVLKFLLKQKDFQQYSKYYEDISEFHKATWSIFVGKERTLLRRGVYPNAKMISTGRTPLSLASAFNELASVRTFMKFPGFDLDSVDDDGKTALHLACGRGHETVVELLLARGIDKMIIDSRGMTAEECAMEGSHFLIARLVKDHANASKTVEAVE